MQLSADAGSDAAVRTARQALGAHLQVGEDSFGLVSVSAVTFRDSSLGCPEPGMMYTPALQSGHKVMLRAKDRVYEVHVAAGRGVVCDAKKSDQKIASRGLAEAAIAAGNKVRDLIASTQKVPAEDVRIVRTRPASRVPDCLPSSSPDAAKGYVVEAKVGTRTYRYHVLGDKTTECSSGGSSR